MSEEIVGSCINHNDIRHLRVYHDYMLIYDGNEHKAKIIRILEAWTNTKRAAWYKAAYDNKEQGKPAPVPDFWITMSHQQFSDYMYGTSKPDTIKKNLKELIEKDKHVERRINPEEPYGSPQYRLNTQAIQKKIDELAPAPFLPEIPEIEESSPSEKHIPPGKTTPGRGVGNTPTQGGSLPIPQGGKTATSNNSNYNTGKNGNREKEKDTSHDGASAHHDDASLSSSENLSQETPPPESGENEKTPEQPHGETTAIPASNDTVTPSTPDVKPSVNAVAQNTQGATGFSAPPEDTPPKQVGVQSPIASDTRTRTTYNRRSGKILIDEWYAMFDELYRKLPGYAPNFRIPQDANSTSAILSMINSGATREQAAFVFKDICNETDPFWHTKRTITCVKSQFATRVSKMNVKQCGSKVSIQQQLYDKEPDFPHKMQWELAEMTLEERREYARRANAYSQAKREQEERAQSVPYVAQQASA